MVVNATHKTVSLGWPRDASPVRKVVTATLVIPIALFVLALVATVSSRDRRIVARFCPGRRLRCWSCVVVTATGPGTR